MFRRALGIARINAPVRHYTDHHHMQYPIEPLIAYGIPGYFFFFFLIWARMSTVYTKRADFKKDYNRRWQRTLGKGYGWAEDFGPKRETIFRNLPTATK
jgi:hypothetical protein